MVIKLFYKTKVLKDFPPTELPTVGTTQADSSPIASSARNRIWIRVTPKDAQRQAEYEYWSGTYTFDCQINGKPSYKHASSNFVLWFHDKKSKS